MKRGTPAPANGLSAPPQLSDEDSPDASYDEVDRSWDSYNMFPQDESSEAEQQFPGPAIPQFEPDNGAAIVRNIASYLTLSDAASMASMDRILHEETAPASANDWAVGMEWGSSDTMGPPVTSWQSSLATPPTPGLMVLSPSENSLQDLAKDKDWDHDDEFMDRRLQRQRKRWVQQRLTAAVFSHPRSIRTYCLEAHQAATKIQRNRRERQARQELGILREGDEDPETSRPECTAPRAQLRRTNRQIESRERLLRFLVDTLLHNVPLSVMIDLAEAVIDTGLDTSYAAFRLSVSSINAIASGLLRVIQTVWDIITSFNPFAILDAIISMQFSAMGKTSEALASGIQSVATGVGSASNMALQRLSRGGGGLTGSFASSSSLNETLGLRRSRSSQNNIVLNRKLLRKLSTINDAAQVVAYKEGEDEVLTRHAKKRVKRMMHYEVNLRPFVATVVDPPPKRSSNAVQKETFGSIDFPSHQDLPNADYPDGVPQVSPQTSASSSPLIESPFMCTPKSFPPTPASRKLVLARGTKFADDVIFLARDQLRVDGALQSDNERTKAMATALRKGKRLAVFNSADTSSDIALSCGQHVATKTGNALYCSTRSMVPFLRNCLVYFEMTVMCAPSGNALLQGSRTTTLSIGLSTLEMPLNTLVGAWKSSVGLCSTGQIMTAGNWCSPLDPSLSSYGHNATVGCLVCLDDSSAFETWDGVMVTASVTFNVNGRVVSPPAFSAPITGPGGMPPGQASDGSPASKQNHQPQPFPGLVPPTTTLPLLVPMEEELFPTLTLHSPATQVLCRFSAADIVATSCTSVGAPQGATVYAVDGSVLFEDEA